MQHRRAESRRAGGKSGAGARPSKPGRARAPCRRCRWPGSRGTRPAAPALGGSRNSTVRQPGEREHLHRGRGAGEVVTHRTRPAARPETSRGVMPPPRAPVAAPGACARSRSAARRRPPRPTPRAGRRTPAAGPLGCAMMPPPAVTIRSVEPRPAKVPGACRTVWPDEKTGIVRHGLSSNIGVRHSRAERITLSSVSENLLARPLTCMWSAPASRQIFCHAI